MQYYEEWSHGRHYGNMGLWSFQTGGTKLEIFLPKNQHTQRKLLNFENWVNGEVSKSAKSPNLGAHFLLLKFFDNINF